MDILIETYHRLLDEVKPLYHRHFYDLFKLDHRMIGIVGGRGVGKTTFLLHYLRENWAGKEDAIYISADHLFFSETTLLDFVDQFYKEHAAKIICIDEIHKYSNWGQELKNIYDSYPKLKIIFSGSSSINLIKGRCDLSRRAILNRMAGFSFREFLECKLRKNFPVIALNNLIDNAFDCSRDISNTPKLLGYFKEYLASGYYPIFTEFENYNAFKDALIAVVDKTIYEDVSNFYSLKTSNLEALRKLIYFIATSSPGEININKLAKSLRKDHSTISEYLEMLRESGLLRFLLIDKRGHALIRNAEKIYLSNTNLAYAICMNLGKDVDIGSTRELFVISQLEDAGYDVFYSKSGDISCDKYVFEIGGKGKGASQIKGVENAFLVKDDILIGNKNEIPLYMFGFLK
ncbi:MAG: AAA family ATPase [Pseudomonadota bacterium]